MKLILGLLFLLLGPGAFAQMTLMQKITEVAAIVQQDLPRFVSNGVQLDLAAAVEPDIFKYQLTFFLVPAGIAPPSPEEIEALKAQTIDAIRNIDGPPLLVLKKLGVRFLNVFRDSGGNEVFSFIVTPQEYAEEKENSEDSSKNG